MAVLGPLLVDDADGLVLAVGHALALALLLVWARRADPADPAAFTALLHARLGAVLPGVRARPGGRAGRLSGTTSPPADNLQHGCFSPVNTNACKVNVFHAEMWTMSRRPGLFDGHFGVDDWPDGE